MPACGRGWRLWRWPRRWVDDAIEMKIATNFVLPAQRAVAPIAAVMAAITVGFAVSAVWLGGEAARLRGALPQLRTRLAHVEAQKPVNTVRLPPARELAAIRARVARINAAAHTKGVPTLALLADLEKHLPRAAWLVSIHHRAARGEVMLVAGARRADPLSDFLLKLEDDPLFEEVMLVREAQSASGRAGVQYEIRLKVRT